MLDFFWERCSPLRPTSENNSWILVCAETCFTRGSSTSSLSTQFRRFSDEAALSLAVPCDLAVSESIKLNSRMAKVGTPTLMASVPDKITNRSLMRCHTSGQSHVFFKAAPCMFGGTLTVWLYSSRGAFKGIIHYFCCRVAELLVSSLTCTDCGSTLLTGTTQNSVDLNVWQAENVDRALLFPPRNLFSPVVCDAISWLHGVLLDVRTLRV